MIMAGSLGYLSTTNGWHRTVAKPTKQNVRQQVVWWLFRIVFMYLLAYLW